MQDFKERHSRTARIYGWAALDRLRQARVAVFGVGGVGGYIVEALARMGVGEIDLCDSDSVAESNINRQIIATYGTVGEKKVDVAAARIHEISPETTVRTYPVFFSEETADLFDFASYDYVADAIDSVKSKVELIARAKAAGVPVISAMGAGNKRDPSAFRVADIEKTRVCPLARAVRTALKKRGIRGVKTVYSEELPASADTETKDTEAQNTDRRPPASTPFCPAVMGLLMANEIVKDLIKTE